MTESSPIRLSPSGHRALAAAAIREADPTVTVPVASALVDTLDAVSAAVLSTVPVISPATAQVVLSLLWTQAGR